MQTHNSECPRWVAWLLLALLVMSIVFFVAATLHPNWVQIGSVKMSALKCENCEGKNSDWLWHCVEDHYCKDLKDAALCSTFHSTSIGVFYCLVLGSVSCYLTLTLSDRVLSYLLRRDYGSPATVYTLAVLAPVLQWAAALVFFRVSGASFTGREDAQALAAPVLVLIAAGIQCISAVLLIYVFCGRDTSADSGLWLSANSKCWLLSHDDCFALVFLCACLAYWLILLAEGESEWVRHEDPDERWSGQLLACEDCPLPEDFNQAEKRLWECVAAASCDSDASSGLCSLYKRLAAGGSAVLSTQFWKLELSSSAFVFLWFERLSMLVRNRDYGVPCVTYLSSIAPFALHLSATIAWFAATDASMVGGCMGDDSPGVCATTGPLIAMATCALMLVAVLTFVIVYARRGRAVSRTDNTAQTNAANLSSAQLYEMPRNSQVLDISR